MQARFKCLDFYVIFSSVHIHLEYRLAIITSRKHLERNSMPRVLVLCTGNSCRSQMAEALWESLSQSINSQQQQWKAASAGSKPSGYVHPLAVEVMREIEIDISNFQSESVEKFRDDNFDLVVTVCNSAKEACPFFPSKNEPLHWPFDDPADATGTDEEKKVVFRRVRDEIKTKIESYLKSLES